jgi:hypothetical protein
METTQNNPFTVDVQNTVARLLSKENIQIHRSLKYKTAFFDMEKRLLGLPVWKSMPREVYDLFIGHEVGHALYTDINDMKSFMSQFGKHSLYNILEDIRIERQIQITYPGLPRLFKKGYNHLFENEFFSTNDLNEINQMNFLDRLNIKAKTGRDVIFADDEIDLANEALSIKTVEELFDVAQKIVDFLKSKNEKQNPQSNRNDDSNQGDSNQDGEEDPSTSEQNDTDVDQNGESQEGEQSQSDETSNDEQNHNPIDESEDADDGEEGQVNESSEVAGSGNSPNQEDDAFKSKTMEDLEKNLKNDIQDSQKNGVATHVELIMPSQKHFDEAVIDYDKILEARNHRRSQLSESIHEKYLVFMKDTKKTVISLANQFEQKKAAFEYSRSRESNCGVIDVNKLHKYKYDDRLFKSVAQLPNSKSHGIVFMIDFSGSMGGERLKEVMTQTQILVRFCKKLNIPFEVYTWTGGVRSVEFDKETLEDQIDFNSMQIINICSSRMTKREFETAIFDMYILAEFQAQYINMVEYHTLGNTPIGNAMVFAIEALKRFKAQNNIQKTTFMFLTDGAGDPICYRTVRKYHNGNTYQTRQHMRYHQTGYLKVNGKVIEFSKVSSRQPYTPILKYFNECGVTTIGYFVSKADHYELANYVKHSDIPEVKKQIRKTGIAAMENTAGFKKFIIINTRKVLQFENEQGLSEDGYTNDRKGTTQLKKDFMKTVKSNQHQKVFTKEFIESMCKSL